MKRFIKTSLLFCFLSQAILYGKEAVDTEHLKEADINKIMDQIFSEHLGQKEINAQILQQAFKTYIDQFDPERNYLLQSEVRPYIQLTPEELQKLTDDYKAGNFSSFEKLNDLLQKAVLRSKNIRKELLTNPDDLFKAAATTPAISQEEWLDPDLKRLFPENEAQLKDRIREQMVRFIQAEQKRYGKEQVEKYKTKLLPLYDNAISTMENDYLFQDNGKPYTAEQKQNAITLHILKALASALDAHTAFFSNIEAYDMRVRLEKEFDGIGVVLQQTPEGIVISSVVDGGPAAKSGQILVKDRLVEIDGKPITGLTLPNVMDLMRGAKDTPIKLVVKRSVDENGTAVEKTITVDLKRAPITVSNDRIDVKSEQFGNGVIGMITLHSFYQGEDGNGSDTDVRKAIEDLDKNGNLRGLILDLRENSGGFLTQAVKVAGLFISNGVVVISKYSNGEERLYRDVDNKAAFTGPLIILTSKATASAAEIVAQALQDYGVALIVGDERTYGKGTIQSQTITGKDNATSFFKVTVGKYYTVSGKTPQLQGVKSDIEVFGPYSHEKIGEEYLEHPLSPDTIKAEYNDDLQDIDPGLRAWYLKYYTPTVQHQVTIWKNMLPILKKNSAYRIQNNKNYQLFLKDLNGGEVNMALFKDDNEEEGDDKKKKNIGHEDIQMQEAVNILKDMIYIQNQNRAEVPGNNKIQRAETANAIK